MQDKEKTSHHDIWIFESHKNAEKEQWSGKSVLFLAHEQLKIIKENPDSKKVVNWQAYRENGQFWATGKYQDDRKTGAWVYYYDNGKIEQQGQYKDGLQNDYWQFFYRNGHSKASGNLSIIGNCNTQQTGTWEFYYENGALEAIGQYDRGQQVGLWKYYDKNKNLIITEDYSDGVLANDILQAFKNIKLITLSCNRESFTVLKFQNNKYVLSMGDTNGNVETNREELSDSKALEIILKHYKKFLTDKQVASYQFILSKMKS